MNHQDQEASSGLSGMRALAESFEDLPGFADSALLSEVVDNAVQKFGFCGDQQSAIELLTHAPTFELFRHQDPQSQKPQWVVRKKV